MLRYSSQTWLRTDLENIVKSLAKALLRGAPEPSEDLPDDYVKIYQAGYRHGVAATLDALATALNLDIPIRTVPASHSLKPPPSARTVRGQHK